MQDDGDDVGDVGDDDLDDDFYLPAGGWFFSRRSCGSRAS